MLYYYIDGVRAYNAGVLKLTDEDGRVFYVYVRSNGQLAIGVYWPTNTNGLLSHQAYNWGSDGRYYPPVTEPEVPENPTEPSEPEDPTEPSEPQQPSEPEQPAVKEGIVEENGVLYYYVDGVRAYSAGVLKLTDEAGRAFYIYVRSNGQLATGIYWPTNTNGLLKYQAYNWGTDGRLYL